MLHKNMMQLVLLKSVIFQLL